MAFIDYTRVDDVVKKHRLTFIQDRLMPPDPTAPLFGDAFRAELLDDVYAGVTFPDPPAV